MNHRNHLRLAGLAAITLSSLQLAAAQTVQPTMMDFLQKDGRFEIFLRLAHTTGVDRWLVGTSVRGCTVLAPTDSAFAKLPQAVLDTLNKYRESETKVIQYHLITSQLSSTQLLSSPQTLEGDLLNLTGGMPPRTARLISKDVTTSNGTVQVIDQVLFPASVLTMLQHEGALPIAVGLPPPKKMKASDVYQGNPLTSKAVRAANKSRRRANGHWVRIPGRGRVWVPNTNGGSIGHA